MLLAKALLPLHVPGCRFKAERDAGVRRDEEVIALGDRRGDVGDAAVRAPGDVRLRHIAGAVRADRKDVVVGKTASDEEEICAGIEDRGGDELLGRSVDDPEQCAGVGIVAGHAFRAGEHHLHAARSLDDERRAVAPGFVRARDAPQLASVVAGECDDIAVAVVVAVHDHLVLVEDGRAAKTVDAREGPGALDPELLAGEIVRGDYDFLVVQKYGEDALAVGRRRARCAAVELVNALRGALHHRRLPENRAGLAIQAEEQAGVAIGGDGEDLPAPYDR